MTNRFQLRFLVLSLSLMAVGGLLYTAEGALQSSYRIPVGTIPERVQPDLPKLASLAPSWLRREVPSGGLVVAVSCVSCSVENVLPALADLDSRHPLIILAVDATPGQASKLGRDYPGLRFVPVSSKGSTLGYSESPRLYCVDRTGKFTYVQRDNLSAADFLAQFEKDVNK
jgi:hypothetical protein